MDVKRALISVSDKRGMVEFAAELQKLGFELISTGGTAKLLKEKKIPVMEVSDYTGSPEMMDGRVKTLHPKVHGGILAMRDNPKHLQEAEINKVPLIDMVVVNLYPFQKTVEKENAAFDEAIENIDIGGPTLVRAAAKNHKYVTVIVDPMDYKRIITELKVRKTISESIRQELAVKAFRHTADYDAAIDIFLSKRLGNEERRRLSVGKGMKLRYGENAHQSAFFFSDSSEEPSLANAKILHGKEMSYNNYGDGDAALEAVKDLAEHAAVSVIKHMNPCGLAVGKSISEAMINAWEGDIVSAFGSVVACSRRVDMKSAQFLKDKFVEVLIAPGYDEDALAFLKEKSRNIRLISVGELPKKLPERKLYKNISGGMLEQTRDTVLYGKWECVTKAKFPKAKEELAKFGIVAAKHTKSNAIVLVESYKGSMKMLGMGAGQPNRVDSFRKLALPKAKENIERRKDDVSKVLSECVLVSDAFFPFPDMIEEAHAAGIKYIVQPGGSVNDPDVIAAADKYGIAMIFIGTRHFRH